MATASQGPAISDRPMPPLPGESPAEEGTTTLLLSLSPEMNGAIETLMGRTGLGKADVLNMAVGFLKAVADATASGQRVGIVGEDQDLDLESVGL